MIEKCPKCGEERKICGTVVNVYVKGTYLGSHTTYSCKVCGNKWNIKHNEVT